VSAITDLRLALQASGFLPIPVCGKRALLPEWQTKINIDATEVAAWDVQFPQWLNTGILTCNTPALDADIRHPEAAAAVEDMARAQFDGAGIFLTRFGEAPKRCMLFRTASPFAKIYADFKAPDGSHHKIEVLCDGQQVVVDGIHPDTKRPYSWHAGRQPWTIAHNDLPEIDEVTARAFVEQAAEMLQAQFGFEKIYPSGNGCPRHTAAGEPVDTEAELATMADGTSVNAVHTRIIPSLLRKGDHPDDVLEFVVNETMTRVGTALNWTRAEEIRTVIRRIMSAYRNLLLKDYDPTTGVIPAWLPGEFHERWIAAIEEGRRPDIGYNRGGFYVRSCGPKTNDAVGAGDGQKTQGETKSQKSSGRRVLVLRPFVPFDVSKLSPRSWLYGKHYQRRTVSLTAGPGGMGKTSNDMVEAIAMVAGRNLLGEQPEERLRVWFHNGEDPRDEIDRRLAAICQHFKIPQEELIGWLWTTSGNEFPLRVAKGYTNLEVDAVLVRQISAAIVDNQIDLAIFDPLVTLHSVSEIDTGKMDAVIRLFAGIADDTDAAIELAHHVRKPAAGSAGDYDVHDIRGVGAITDAVRAARVLNRMNEKDAEAAGCSEIERLSRFRVDRAKGNYSPAQVATWRQFVNVELSNGDDVGVVAPWNFPGQGEQTPEKTAADQKAERVFLQLLDKFLARGINVGASTGPSSAPAKFAEQQEAKAANVSKAALKAAMNRLLDTGRIRSEPYGRSDRASSRLVPRDRK
jgi:RecA-family ATPase